jgi:hypothetical protein
MKRLTTKLGYNIDIESKDDLIEMVLHDSFGFQLDGHNSILCIRVIGGWIYRTIINGACQQTFVKE